MANLIGQRLGSYYIVELIGQGGMAEVYKALQKTGLFSREVAIKVVNSRLVTDPQFLARFQREAQTIAQLSHPHILKLFDFNVYGNNVIYLVMEYLSGGTLADRLAKGPLGNARILRYLSHITEALDYAHDRQIIHRDIKPANVLLDSEDNAFLADFGLAKIQDEVSQTQAGSVMGTAPYMPPEQWRGELLTVQADIYALGIMIYEMFTGSVPFRAQSTASLMYSHLNEDVVWPDWQQLGIPANVEKVLARALAKRPNNRYSTAGDLFIDLYNTLSGVSVQVPKVPSPADRISSSEIDLIEKLPPENRIAKCSLYIQHAPNDPILYYIRAVAYDKLEKAPEAYADYTRAIELQPAFVRAYIDRAWLRYTRGKMPEALVDALSDLNMAAKIDPGQSEPQFYLALIYMYQQQMALARTAIEKALALQPEISSYWVINARILKLQGGVENLRNAFRAFQKGVELASDSADAHFWRGRNYMDMARAKRDPDPSLWNKAIDDFNQAVRLDLRYLEAYFWRAQAFYEMEAWSPAEQDLDLVLHVDPQHIEALRLRGLVRDALGNTRAAAEDCRAVLGLNPTHPSADRMRAYIDQFGQ